MKNTLSTVFVATSLALAGTMTGHAADTVAEYDASGGVRIGYLSCNIGEGGGYLLGSAKELDCTFHSSFSGDPLDHYTGVIKKFGIDLGYTAQGGLVWAVFAPTAGYHQGSLKGDYFGAAAEATIGAGLGANVLLGGTGGSIQLQPISVSGQLGLNVAAAKAFVTLYAAR
ncbi:DUF992 domain-containing protein [Rhizobium sp. KVB221]|uniref:DUF992 domain-containing protein n=1 Tax=Rhizobium setariae TaxID=2801340 RepID=A0A936YTG2_9HYPH|nr:DUF992 domain-containing protein [Rhizobium setariae]MBL0372447.1 DUF992 domain-containing protein [Rhizobium setariae]